MTIIRTLLIPAVTFPVLCFGCGGTTFVDTSELPDTYQCTHMEEVCKEAREFERSYAKLSAEEKKDAETILKTYRNQCNDALDMCKKSASLKGSTKK